jgi:geranylgeranylglycerol-phosphate geranylgeranyltransferase
MSAVGYGNVVNDIKDVETDRISHPKRPLPRKLLSIETAGIFAFFLGCFSLVNAFLVGPAFGLGALAALALLSLYAFYFKGTPFFGNVVVSALAAYPLVFGGLRAPLMHRLLLPAFLAFLLNLAREIIKDMQDEPGDRLSGLMTSASMPKGVLKALVRSVSILYVVFLFVPFFLHQFGAVYAFASAILVLPLHLYWSLYAFNTRWTRFLSKISLCIKLEMLAGLAALAADQAF